MPTTAKKTKPTKGFSDFERAAMKERAQELMLGKDDGESALLAKIAEMDGQDKIMAEKLHEIVKVSAPTLIAKTWYGMPAYAKEDGKVIFFFQSAKKFKARYATLGFSDLAKLDDGEIWPTSFALKKMSSMVEAKIIELVKRAIS